MVLEKDVFYPAKVVKIEKFGIIVEMEDRSTILVHISNISNSFVSDPANFVSVGETHLAKCIEGKTRPLELSLKHLDLKDRSQIIRNMRRRTNDADNRTGDKPQGARSSNYTDKKPYKGDHKRSAPSSAFSQPKSSKATKLTLDEMIEQSEKAFKDKTGYDSANRRTASRRRNKKPQD